MKYEHKNYIQYITVPVVSTQRVDVSVNCGYYSILKIKAVSSTKNKNNYGKAWHAMAWHGMAWHGMSSQFQFQFQFKLQLQLQFTPRTVTLFEKQSLK
jgi:hypothetical protein